MFFNLFLAENVKIFKRKILWVELAILALLLVFLNGLMYASIQMDLGNAGLPEEARQEFMKSLVWPGSLLNSIGFANSGALGGLLAIVLVGSITAQEYTWRNFHLWLSRGAPRLLLLSARFAALLLPLLLIVLTPLLAGGALTAWFSMQVNGTLHLEQIDALQVLWMVLRTTYTLLPYAAMTFLLAILTRSTAAAIGIGIAYALLLEGVLVQILRMLGGAFENFWLYLPSGMSASLLQLNETAVRVNVGAASNQINQLLDPGLAALGLALWTLLFTGLSLLVFYRQDLTE